MPQKIGNTHAGPILTGHMRGSLGSLRPTTLTMTYASLSPAAVFLILASPTFSPPPARHLCLEFPQASPPPQIQHSSSRPLESVSCTSSQGFSICASPPLSVRDQQAQKSRKCCKDPMRQRCRVHSTGTWLLRHHPSCPPLSSPSSQCLYFYLFFGQFSLEDIFSIGF